MPYESDENQLDRFLGRVRLIRKAKRWQKYSNPRQTSCVKIGQQSALLNDFGEHERKLL